MKRVSLIARVSVCGATRSFGRVLLLIASPSNCSTNRSRVTDLIGMIGPRRRRVGLDSQLSLMDPSAFRPNAGLRSLPGPPMFRTRP